MSLFIMFCYAVDILLFSFAIILVRKRELVAFGSTLIVFQMRL